MQMQCQYVFIKIIFAMFSVFSSVFFWFLVIIAGYWFIFFKLQEHVYILLPQVNHSSTLYYYFDVLFGLVLATKVIHITCKIFFDQCGFDVFLIDWEKPKQ